MNRQRKKLLRQISEKVNDIEIEDKRYILNIIAFKYGMDILYEEGQGLRILFDELDCVLLKEIWKLIEKGLKKTTIPP